MKKMDIEGAIFDVDGTLLDSMGYWEHLGDEYLLSRQLQPPENLANLLASMTLLEAAEYFKKHYGITDEAEEMIKDFDQLMAGHYREEIPEKEGVRQVLYEMVYNLCDNAIKYNKPDGKVKISVGCSRDRHPIVRVEDTGIGIPKEEQQRVFERFYRVDKSHSRATGGTGLGLSIVKHGAILHDAKIEVDSTPDVGTSITLEFGAQ